jgi:hypothetical protein
VKGADAFFIVCGLFAAVGAALALGAGAPATFWVALACTSVALTTLTMIRLPPFLRGAPPPERPTSPHFVDRVRDAVRGDRLAREYVLERIDAWELAPSGSPPGRLAADARLYDCSPEAFRFFLQVVVRSEEGPR